MAIIISVSGGKDSTAMLLKAIEEYPKSQITPVFCDTGWEHEFTYEYLEYLEKVLDINITRIKNNKYPGGMLDLILKKRFIPNSNPLYRFCSYELKKVPIWNFLKNLPPVSRQVWVGVRTEESSNRARKYADIYPEEIFPYRELHPKSPKACEIHFERYPIINWTIKDVIDIFKKHNLDINPLYYQGFNRVGCFPCIISSLKFWKIAYGTEIGKRNINKLIEIEKELNKNGCNATLKPKLKGEEILTYLQSPKQEPPLFEEEIGCSFCAG